MPVLQKRTRGETDAPEPKKGRVQDPIAEKVEVIKCTVANPECPVPGGELHRDMLLASIPHTLTVPFDERHEYQNTMAQMVEVVLNAAVANCETKVSDAQAKVDLAEQQSKQAMTNLEESASRLEAQEEEVVKCREVLTADSEAAKASQEALAVATKEVTDFDANLQVTIDEKNQYSLVYEEFVAHLKSDSIDQKKTTHLVKKMEPLLKSLGTESSLLSAMAPAMKKSPAVRGAFDVMAVEGIEAQFTKHLGTLQEQIDKADTIKAAKITAQSDAQAALDVAKGKETASEHALKEAETTHSSMQASHQEMFSSMDCTSEMEAITEHGVCADKLGKTQQALDTFTELFERKTSVPPTADDDEVPSKAEDVSEPVCEISA